MSSDYSQQHSESILRLDRKYHNYVDFYKVSLDIDNELNSLNEKFMTIIDYEVENVTTIFHQPHSSDRTRHFMNLHYPDTFGEFGNIILEHAINFIEWKYMNTHPSPKEEYDKYYQRFKGIPVQINDIQEHREYLRDSLSISQMHGVRTTQGKILEAHGHFPAFLSYVYYPEVPEGAPPLVFPDCDKGIEIKSGDLMLFFNLDMIHIVPKTDFEGYRYTIAGEIYHAPFLKYLDTSKIPPDRINNLHTMYQRTAKRIRPQLNKGVTIEDVNRVHKGAVDKFGAIVYNTENENDKSK